MLHDMVVWAPALGGTGVMLTTFAHCALTWKPSPESWARIDAESEKQRAKQAARKQRKMKPEPTMLTCEAPSPDNQLICDLEIGHWGWHRNAETEWFGEVWDIDHWADTQQAEPIRQEATVAAEAWPFGPYPAPPGWRQPLKFDVGPLGNRRPHKSA